MPLELGSLPVRLSLTIQDRDGNTGEAVRYIDGITTIIDAEAQMIAFESAIAPLTDGNIIGGSISIPLVQTSAFVLPPESADVERKGVFVFELEDGRSARYSVPSLDNGVVTDLSREGNIDPGQLAVVGYTALMEASVNGGGVQLRRLARAFKRHRRSGKGGA